MNERHIFFAAQVNMRERAPRNFCKSSAEPYVFVLIFYRARSLAESFLPARRAFECTKSKATENKKLNAFRATAFQSAAHGEITLRLFDCIVVLLAKCGGRDYNILI